MVRNKKVLNQEQIQAIEYKQGPLLIIAGAGTGKTTVVTERIKHLISSKLAKPSEILALTFTEKAALEMEQRVDEIMPLGFFQMWISTFHAFCDRILRDEALNIGLDSHYVLMTEAETLLFLKNHLFDFKLDYFRPAGNPTRFLNGLLVHFNRLKDEDISPKKYFDWVKEQQQKPTRELEEIKKDLELAKAYKRYEELKTKEGMMDFADLIGYVLILFRKRKNILKKYQQKFKYILVDEFQDTNVAQNKLVVLLAGEKPNLTVVADDDQSIYKWRGAAISNVLQFKQKYPKAQIITLTKNYRSTQKILDKAYQLIQYNNPDRLEVKEKISKKLVATRQIRGEEIKFLFCNRVEDESDSIAKEIKKLTTQKIPYNYGEIAVLIRANNYAEPFVSAFFRNGIPFQFLGPGRLFRQDEVKDLIAYLRILYNFEDNVSFFRILSLPIFDISSRDIAALRNFSKRINISLFEAAEQADKLFISQESKEKIKKLVDIIHRHLKLIATETAGQITYYFLQDSGLLQQLAEPKTENDQQKIDNIAKFFNKLKTHEVEYEDSGVEAVVDWINLKTEMGESPLASDNDWTQENKVNILTIHGSKGLEFPVVFMINLVADRFPTRDRKDQIPIPDDLIEELLPKGDSHEQEERRLFYVGMTRAKDLLFFSAAKYYGEAKRIKKISFFVYEALGDEKVKNSLQVKNIEDNQLSIFDFQPIEKTAPNLINQTLSYPVNFLSYSQIETFKMCPLQYKYKYFFQIPVPAFAAASFGTSIHDVLKDFYQQIRNGLTVDKEKLIKFLEGCWQKEGYSSKAHEQRMYQRAQHILTEFFDKTYKKEDNPVTLEQTFTLRISPTLQVGGRIDRIDRLSDGKIEIIDYKTGRLATQNEIDKNLQMTLYAMAANDPGLYNQKLENIILSFYFFEAQEKISTQRTKKQLEVAKKEILKKAEEIKKSDFNPTPGPFCDFCSFKIICPVW